jgi:transposase
MALSASSLRPLPTSRLVHRPGILSGVDTLDTATPVVPCSRPDCYRALTEARQQAGFYKAMFQGAKAREAELQEQLAQAKAAVDARLLQQQQRIDELQAQVRLLHQRLYGRSCEAHHTPNTLAHSPDGQATPGSPDAATAPAPRRPRGQQRGRPGHGRRSFEHLPATLEVAELPPDQRCCGACGLPFAPCGSEPNPTTLVEVEVRAHRRVIRRRRYRPTCACGCQPELIVAPPPPRLIPNSALGISVWVQVLLDKYASYRPTHRLLAQWRLHGLDLAQGTITDGLQRLVPLFEPVYESLRTQLQQQDHWHGDETHWQVFASIEGKVGYKWYLWLVLSAEVAVFTLAAGRNHEVPEDVLGDEARGIFNADRYTAYPAMKQVKAGQVILALCWAHQRRDFIEAERGHPELNAWASAWLGRIADLYRLNDARLLVWQPPEASVPTADWERREHGPESAAAVPTPAVAALPARELGQAEVAPPEPPEPAAPECGVRPQTAAFAAADQNLRTQVAEMARQSAAEQQRKDLAPAARAVLESLDRYWVGLTVFVEHPEVPLDNNAAERAERGPVVGRKNYYGSGAVWSGRLAAMLFSIFETLRLGGLNARQWLTGYLTACAENGGQPLSELRHWLPWQMTEAERAELKLPAKAQGPSSPGTEDSS